MVSPCRPYYEAGECWPCAGCCGGASDRRLLRGLRDLDEAEGSSEDYRLGAPNLARRGGAGRPLALDTPEPAHPTRIVRLAEAEAAQLTFHFEGVRRL